MKILLIAFATLTSAHSFALEGVDKETVVYGTPYLQRNFCAGSGKSPKEECQEWLTQVATDLRGNGALAVKTECDSSGVIGCTYSGSYHGTVYFVK